jgi:hypothetical protein
MACRFATNSFLIPHFSFLISHFIPHFSFLISHLRELAVTAAGCPLTNVSAVTMT